VVNFATTKYVSSTMFPHCSINRLGTSPDGKMHNQNDHILTDKRQHQTTVYVELMMTMFIIWWLQKLQGACQ